MLPPRIEVGKRDVVTIRAFREGFRQKSVTLKATGREKQGVINLEPLPNTLETFAHRYFGFDDAIYAGRAVFPRLPKSRSGATSRSE